MRYLKIMSAIVLIFLGSVVGAQAKSGFVPTYEQTAEEVYLAYKDSIEQHLYQFQNTSNDVKRRVLADIEAGIADDFGTSKEHVQMMIADYKQDYITIMDEEVRWMKKDMFEGYATDKRKLIEEEITDDISTFLDRLLTE